MYAVIRIYSGARTLADELKKHNKAIKSEMGSVAGFVSYQFIHTPGGAVTITVCDNARGCEESSRRAAVWMSHNLPELDLLPPAIQSGEVAFQFSRAPALV
jgi:hypothetical protein